MHVLIVEDEALLSQRLERLSRRILDSPGTVIHTCASLSAAQVYIAGHPIDLLLLDLNLDGRDGFELLKEAVARAFHTIIVSAYAEKAIEAFEYGVLDFVAKPFNEARLRQAFQRFQHRAGHPTKYLAVRRQQQLRLIDVKEVVYVQGSGNYSELHLANGATYLHDKYLNRLENILPGNFFRIHRSYLLNLNYVVGIEHHGSGKYEVTLTNDTRLPVSRKRYQVLKEALL